MRGTELGTSPSWGPGLATNRLGVTTANSVALTQSHLEGGVEILGVHSCSSEPLGHHGHKGRAGHREELVHPPSSSAGPRAGGSWGGGNAQRAGPLGAMQTPAAHPARGPWRLLCNLPLFPPLLLLSPTAALPAWSWAPLLCLAPSWEPLHGRCHHQHLLPDWDGVLGACQRGDKELGLTLHGPRLGEAGRGVALSLQGWAMSLVLSC